MTQHRRALIADLSSLDRENYSTFLTGWELVFADSFAELRNLVPSQPPGREFDVVIVSWQLPGSEVLVWLQRETPELPVIIVDGSVDPAVIHRAKMLGAFECLFKPLVEERLREALRQALRDDELVPLVTSLQQRLIGQSRLWRAVLESLARVISRSEAPVLLLGESGTGKELAARAIHDLGLRCNEPYVACNLSECAASLVESEIFGHRKGAFTGADHDHAGLLERCGAGTIFLDEIGDLSDQFQLKLLRVLQERTFRRLQDTTERHFRGRLVCATHRPIADEVEAKRFRLDLYQRIKTHEITLPPLRERREDWLLLSQYFLAKHAPGRPLKLSHETRAVLWNYGWPGNARELEGLIQDVLVRNPVAEILPNHLPKSFWKSPEPTPDEPAATQSWPDAWMERSYREAHKELTLHFDGLTLEFDRQYLARLLKKHDFNITQAASGAGLDRKTFRNKCRDLGVSLGPPRRIVITNPP